LTQRNEYWFFAFTRISKFSSLRRLDTARFEFTIFSPNITINQASQLLILFYKTIRGKRALEL
jgi:hypothetical protein